MTLLSYLKPPSPAMLRQITYSKKNEMLYLISAKKDESKTDDEINLQN